MAKNRKTSSGTQASQETIESNNEVLKELLWKISDTSDEDIIKEELTQIINYCNKNGLELQESNNNFFNIFDKESGITFSFKQNVFGKQDWDEDLFEAMGKFDSETMIDNIDKTIKSTRSILQTTNHDFNKGLKNITFENEVNNGGFNPYQPDNINISPLTFAVINTGIKGTIIHELAHNYEFNTYGSCGYLKEFADMKSYPCRYAKTEYDMWGGVKPECLATTIEMVYTKSLREDALMRDGNSVTSAFYKKYNKAPETEQDYKKAYNIWYNEWLPLTETAENIYK